MEIDGLEHWKNQAQQWLHQGHEVIDQIPPTQLYTGIGVVLLTIFFLLLIRLFKRTKSNTIVIAGLSGSGKTVLFYQLQDGSSHQGTVTSMEPNEGTFLLHSETTKKGKIKPVHVVDVPGHSRLRPKLDEFLPQAAGIVFVVDAVEFLPNCRAASEYLYDILTKGGVVKKKIPVLILCNKVDKVTAHTTEFIRKQLVERLVVFYFCLWKSVTMHSIYRHCHRDRHSTTHCHRRCRRHYSPPPTATAAAAPVKDGSYDQMVIEATIISSESTRI